MPSFIALENVSFAYRDPQGKTYPVLHDISLEINQGELVAITGANGSGKTTFIRHLNGLLLPDQGRVRVGGQDTRSPAGRRAIHQLVGMVFQHPEDQIISSTLEDEVAFGPENLGRPSDEIRQQVEESLRTVGLWEIRLRPPHLLSAGQTQRLALAGVLAMQPRCIVFDEATTMLDPSGRRMALNWMLRLHEQGITILFVTHHMEEAALAQRVIVFDGGQIALDSTPRQVFSDPARLAALGLDLPPAGLLAERLRPALPSLQPQILTAAELQSAIQKLPRPQPGGQQNAAASAVPDSVNETNHNSLIVASSPFIAVTDLSHTYLDGTPLAQLSLQDVSLEVAPGVSHGLLGPTGSGKSTLLQHLNGLLRPQKGRVQVGPFNLADPAVQTRSVIQLAGLVFQNPEMQFFEQYVGDEIAYGPRQFPGPALLAERVRGAMELVGMDFETFKDRLLFTLSGGERRKVALASVLALHPSILLLDEPTAGLDPHSHLEILDRLKRLQSGGMTLVLSSHRMEDLAELAQSLTLFDGGRALATGSLAHILNQQGLLEGAGLEQPLAVQAAGWLRQAGWPVPAEVVTPVQLADYVGSVQGAEAAQ